MKKYLLTILIALMIPAVVMPQDVNIIDINDFTGGLNTRDGSGGIADNEFTDIYNCFLDYKGISKRQGFATYTSTNTINGTNEGTGIYYVPFTGGEKIVGVAGTKIAYKSGTTWVDITGNVTITADKPVIFAMVNNTVVMCNGTDSTFYWTGTGNAATLTSAQAPSAPKTLAEYHGRLFLAQGRRLYWSRYMADWTDFHPDDWQDFNEPITGLQVLGETTSSILVILCTRSIHYASFDPTLGETVGGRGTFRFDHLSFIHGCISPYSVKECITPNGDIVLIWADTDGLKMLSPDLKVVKISDKIDPTWQDMDQTQLPNSIGFHYKTRRWYGLIMRTVNRDYNDRVIIYDLRNWCVSGIFDWPCSFLDALKSSGQDILVGSDKDGYWYQYDYGDNDNSVAIEAFFTTKAYDGGQPLYDKRWVSLNFQHEYRGNYNFDISTYFNYGSDVSAYTKDYTYSTVSAYTGLGSFILGVDILGSTRGDFILAGQEIGGSGQYAQVRIGNDDADEPFKIYRLQITYRPGRMVLMR